MIIFWNTLFVNFYRREYKFCNSILKKHNSFFLVVCSFLFLSISFVLFRSSINGLATNFLYLLSLSLPILFSVISIFFIFIIRFSPISFGMSKSINDNLIFFCLKFREVWVFQTYGKTIKVLTYGTFLLFLVFLTFLFFLVLSRFSILNC